jgi:pimeloyl-ACP methyl ester carboxylesterase
VPDGQRGERADRAEAAAAPGPALILWGTDDVFFDVKWAYWLGERLPNARVVEVPGARLFFPEERPAYFASEVRAFWEAVDAGAASRASALA